MHDINFHQNIGNGDPLMMAQGAFASLCKNYSVEIVRGDLDFAVEATFPLHMIVTAFKELFIGKVDRWNRSTTVVRYDEIDQYINQNFPKKSNHFNEIKLFLPHQEIAIQTNLTKAVGLGATEHELGHIICDLANQPYKASYFHRIKDHLLYVAQRVERRAHEYDRFSQRNSTNIDPKIIINHLFNGLDRWVNIAMDIRLENMMRFMYPSTKHRFLSLQDYIFKIENLTGITHNFTSIFPLLIRDLGKNHQSDAFRHRLDFYQRQFPYSYHIAHSLKHLWQALQIQSKDCVGTVHIPFQCALAILTELDQLIEKYSQNKPVITTEVEFLLKKELLLSGFMQHNEHREPTVHDMIPLIRDCIYGRFSELDAGKMLSAEIKAQVKGKGNQGESSPHVAHQKYIPSHKKMMYLKNTEAAFQIFRH